MSHKDHLKIEPSLFAGDFGCLADEARRIEDSGADAIHFDIMDGHFVPNLSLSPKALSAVNKATDIFLDVHIMVYNPYDYIERLIEAGADQITFHVEATENVEDTINFIRRCGKKAGLAICPETSTTLVMNYIDKIDMLLLMTVHPGFGGQAFIPEVIEKIRFIRSLVDRLHIQKGGITQTKEPQNKNNSLPFDIQVDGGINEKTAKQCVEAGANILVAGSYLFEGDMKRKIELLRNL